MTRTKERGAAMVEFAIVVPFVMLLLFACVEVGLRYLYVAKLNSAAQVAARDMTIGNDDAHALALARTAMGTWDSATSVVIPDCVPGENVTVVFTVTRDAELGLVPGTYTAVGTGVARCQE